jgi:hypothetical protein
MTNLPEMLPLSTPEVRGIEGKADFLPIETKTGRYFVRKAASLISVW